MNNTRQQKITKDIGKVTASNIVGVRFSDDVLGEIDAEVEKRRQEAPWAEITRVDVIREAVYRLLHPQAQELPQATTESLPKLTLAPAPKSTSAVECLVCNEALPKNHKALCGRPACKKEIHRRREADRRKAVKG